ncbi:MAG: glycosyltransferase family 2 protein [Chlorobiaceae bacterium]|nr:glycosyltransferase family 2 protein [Chlorobiaceae bacterium]
MTSPLISVIMPAFNAGSYIAAALRSILLEKNLNLDIIVIDDGSTDSTPDIVQSIALSNPAIRLISAPHAGVSRARNLGLASVPEQAQYITFLDSDDLNAPGRIARQLQFMQQDSELDSVIGLIQLFEAADEQQCVPLPGSRTMTVKGVSLSAALFTKRLFDRLGGFDEQMPNCEDTDFYLRMLESRSPYITEDKVAIMYRRHNTNMTNDIAAIRRGFIDTIRRSLARRRKNGAAAELGDLFKNRSNAEEMFNHG